ncbi:LysR family transcriptional regulator [Luteolibacter flavescens]|uniref:LysR family transcriptional regulator n=1 Tax=Luteolibacter flavescens TaxID=1859460 RepID=A0ABT3FIY9_9BACT|nr:LysR family transcriptional regulator [Luteolibacter flavescens]MCW1883528.1 LysR family transcriptional regulator [Luteolibacter flavescens]
MELYQLRTFLTIAEEGNLTRAAEKLFTSQPAVSAQVKQLEEELGVKLFERSARGMALTREGKMLQEKARRIVEAARDFKHSAESLRETVSGELVFGLNNRPEVLKIVEVLGALTSEHPELNYDLVNGSSGTILEGIDDGSISIGFFEGVCEFPRIESHVLEPIELCIAAPAAWARELSSPDWKVLETKPWIFVSRACSYFRAIESICSDQGLKLQQRFRVDECLTVLNLVAEGLGLTLAARNHIEAPEFQGRIIALPHFQTTVNLSIGYLRENADRPAVAAARDVVLGLWKNDLAARDSSVTRGRGIRAARPKGRSHR